MPPVDYSWSESTLYACRCGTMYPARRWRWVDADEAPRLLQRVRRDGPWEGECPSCGEAARARSGWLRVNAGNEQASLVLHPSRRGDLIEELRAHLARVQVRAEVAPAWLLQPTPELFDLEGDTMIPRGEETTARRLYAGLVAEDAEQTGVRREPSRPVVAAATEIEIEPTAPVIAAVAPVEVEVDAERLAEISAEELSIEEIEPEIEPEIPVETREEPGEEPGDRSGLGAAEPIVAEVDEEEEVALARPAATDDPDAGVPQLIGADGPSPAVAARPSALAAHVADLTLDEVVTFRVRVSANELPQWEAAHLMVRPIHLRTRGYPLVGVRVVGSYMGQVGCIDAVVDVGSTLASDVFRRLSERFAATLVIEHGSRDVSRTIEAEGLESNAALCIESARGILARGEYPPQEFDKARRALEAEPADVRLAPPEVSLSSGAYRHIIGAREAVAALEHLERVSQKETLARLLEVDGLPMAEYDEIRRRVLEGSLVYGLCAPRRFWRRLVASGLARDLPDYARRLSSNRQEHEGEEGDLGREAAHEAWLAIHDLCRRKDIVPAPELRKALDLPGPGPGPGPEPEPEPGPEPGPVAATPPPPPRRQISGEIRSGEINDDTKPPPGSSPHLGNRLRDPDQRLRAATEVLQGRASPDDLGQVISALEEFEADELLALLPDLNDLGLRAVPGLLAKLQSDRREVRQAATILLGMSREPEAMQRLSDHLVCEQTTVWRDVARALGWYGTAAIRGLCQLLAKEASTPREQLAIDRVSRALAEIAVSPDSGQDTSVGRDAVRALADAPDPRVSTAARRALASLPEVTTSGAQMRGEIPLAEVTEIRSFARRAYEAIMVPELEVEAEA